MATLRRIQTTQMHFLREKHFVSNNCITFYSIAFLYLRIPKWISISKSNLLQAPIRHDLFRSCNVVNSLRRTHTHICSDFAHFYIDTQFTHAHFKLLINFYYLTVFSCTFLSWTFEIKSMNDIHSFKFKIQFDCESIFGIVCEICKSFLLNRM